MQNLDRQRRQALEAAVRAAKHFNTTVRHLEKYGMGAALQDKPFGETSRIIEELEVTLSDGVTTVLRKIAPD